MKSSVNAPMKPPVTVLSSPMIAFCTVFDSESSTTRSNGLSCASSRLPNTRSRSDEEDVDQDRAEDLLEQREREDVNMCCRIVCIAVSYSAETRIKIAADDDRSLERLRRAARNVRLVEPG